MGYKGSPLDAGFFYAPYIPLQVHVDVAVENGEITGITIVNAGSGYVEDEWIPRREGPNHHEIQTLPGIENLGEVVDADWKREKIETLKEKIRCQSPTSGLMTTPNESHQFADSPGLGSELTTKLSKLLKVEP